MSDFQPACNSYISRRTKDQPSKEGCVAVPNTPWLYICWRNSHRHSHETCFYLLRVSRSHTCLPVYLVRSTRCLSSFGFSSCHREQKWSGKLFVSPQVVSRGVLSRQEGKFGCQVEMWGRLGWDGHVLLNRQGRPVSLRNTLHGTNRMSQPQCSQAAFTGIPV